MAYTSPDTCTITGTLRPKDESAATNDLTFTCTATSSSTSSPTTCTIGAGTKKDGSQYLIKTIACDSASGEGTPTLGAQTKFFGYSTKYVALGTQQTAQTIDYNTTTTTFSIKYATTAQTDSPATNVLVSNSTKTITLTDCTFADTTSTLTCTAKKTQISGSKDGLAYTVKVTNTCGMEEDTGITLTVKEPEGTTPSSSSNFLEISKMMLIIGLFFF